MHHQVLLLIQGKLLLFLLYEADQYTTDLQQLDYKLIEKTQEGEEEKSPNHKWNNPCPQSYI